MGVKQGLSVHKLTELRMGRQSNTEAFRPERLRCCPHGIARDMKPGCLAYPISWPAKSES